MFTIITVKRLNYHKFTIPDMIFQLTGFFSTFSSVNAAGLSVAAIQNAAFIINNEAARIINTIRHCA